MKDRDDWWHCVLCLRKFSGRLSNELRGHICTDCQMEAMNRDKVSSRLLAFLWER